MLKEVLAEYQRRGNFERIFPAKGTCRYHKFFYTQNNLNQFIYDFIYESKKEEAKFENNENLFSNNLIQQSCLYPNRNDYFKGLEAKLRPFKQRPDSAVNAVKFHGLIQSDNNSSTVVFQHNESFNHVSDNRRTTTEDILIAYFQNVVDMITGQFGGVEDKSVPIIDFSQLERSKARNQPVITRLSQASKGMLFRADAVDTRKRAKSSYGASRRIAPSKYSWSCSYFRQLEYLTQRYENLSKYFRMSIEEVEHNAVEQAYLVQTLESIISKLKL